MATWYGSSGNDYLNWIRSEPLNAYAGAGNDTIWGNNYNDNLKGDSGNDSLLGWYGNDMLMGNSGNDTLKGEYGNDSLEGGLGNDSLSGGDGNDIINGFWYTPDGNGEVDQLRGDAGADTFVIGHYEKGYIGRSWAVIQDFNWREDYIKVQGSLGQYTLRAGNLHGYSSNDTAIVLSSNPNEVLAVALGVSTSNGTIQLTSRDFVTT